MTTPRALAMAASTALVVLSIVGCGAQEPAYDPGVRYSPGSLARELSFQYQALKSPGDRPAPTKGGGPTEGTGIARKASKETTKEAPVATLDDLIADVIAKAGTIPGLSRLEACKKVAEEVAKDPSIPEADRKAIAERLGNVAP